MASSPEALLGVVDNGATHTRVAIMNTSGDTLDFASHPTNPDDYEGSVLKISETLERQADGQGEIRAVSIAIASEVDPTDMEGVLTKSGALSTWTGRHFRRDISDALNLGQEQVGVMNDVVAIARSQQAINEANGRPLDGVAATLSSGFNDALYSVEGMLQGDEAGHEHLRNGADCPCGGHGHVEAFISGNGIQLNQGMSMAEWLKSQSARDQLIGDVSLTLIELLERHAKSGFTAEEFRWTGGVAIGQPFIIRAAEEDVRKHIGDKAPAFDSVTMGEQAGIHGTFVDARKKFLEDI